MSEVVQKVSRLLATDVQDDVDVVSQLLNVYEDYQRTRNLLYPQKDLLAYLVNCLQKPARMPELHSLAMTLLTQFCEPPLGCDAEKIRGWLVNLGLIEVLCDFLESVNFATAFPPDVDEAVRAERVELLERSTALLLAMSSSMLPAKQSLVIDKLIRVLCQLCVPSARCGRMFDYPVQCNRLIQEVMCNSRLFATSITFSEPATSNELFGLLFGCRALCSEHAFVDVMLARSADSSELHSLADKLVDTAFFWPRQTKVAKCSMTSSADSVGQATDLSFDSHQDAHRALKALELGDVVRGCHFFARLIDPASTANKLNTIEDLLVDTKHELLNKLPLVGDMVTCFGPRPKRRVQLLAQPMSSTSTDLSECSNMTGSPSSDVDGSNSIYFRGQILRTVSGSCYEVLAIDYGVVVTASSEHFYKECSALLHVKPDAVLCTLRGVGSIPVSDVALGNVIDTLRVISKGRPAIGRRIAQWFISTHLVKLLECCPLPEINGKAASLLAELSRDGHLRPHLQLAVFGATPANSTLLCLAKRFVEKGWIKAASAVFTTVANMLICDEGAESADFAARTSRLKNADVQLLLGIINNEVIAKNARDRSPEDRAELFAAALQCVRNFFGRHASKHLLFEEGGPAMSRPTSSSSARLQSSRGQGLARATSLLATSRSSPALVNAELVEKQPVSVERRSSSSAALGVPSPNGSCRSFAAVDRGMSLNPRKCRTESAVAVEVSQFDSSPVQPAFTVSLSENALTRGRREPPDYTSFNPCETMPEATSYVLGTDFPYTQDNEHEILDGRLLTAMSATDLTMHLNAFSNSESGGSLFFGVSGGKVCGVFVDRGQRDSIRLRMDTLNPFDKSRSPKSFRTSFCTIIDPKTNCLIPDTYVIELAVQPSAFNSVFRQKRTDKVYIRKCNKSVVASASDIRELGLSRGLRRLAIASSCITNPLSCLDSALMANERGRQFDGRRS